MQKIFTGILIGFIIVLLLSSILLSIFLYNERTEKNRVVKINQRLENQFGEQNRTIQELEDTQRTNRTTITQLKEENRRLRELQQQTINIITGIESTEGVDSERLKRLEQIIRNLPEKQ